VLTNCRSLRWLRGGLEWQTFQCLYLRGAHGRKRDMAETVAHYGGSEYIYKIVVLFCLNSDDQVVLGQAEHEQRQQGRGRVRRDSGAPNRAEAE